MDALKVHSRPADLRRPILIMAFGGWNDAAESATTAVRYLGTSFRAEKFAEIDPEEFYHFGLARPHVRFKAGSETDREITWPTTDFSISQASALARDDLLRGGAGAGAAVRGDPGADGGGTARRGAAHPARAPVRHRVGSRAGRSPGGAPDEVRGTDRDRRRAQHGLQGAGRCDGEP